MIFVPICCNLVNATFGASSATAAGEDGKVATIRVLERAFVGQTLRCPWPGRWIGDSRCRGGYGGRGGCARAVSCQAGRGG